MEKMLKETGLCNISGSYLSNDKKAANKGIPLEFKKNKVVFGYIRRKNDETDELMEELLGFLREKLNLKMYLFIMVKIKKIFYIIFL